MSYYDTIADDLKRAKEILDRGRLRDEDLSPTLAEDLRARMLAGGGTIYGGDTYAAYKLLESFVAEIERLQDQIAIAVAFATLKPMDVEDLASAIRRRLGADEAGDCTCRTPQCGHRASRHVGAGGACIEPGCTCGPGGWS